MDRAELDALSDLVERERQAWLRRSSLGFLECAIHLLASHLSPDEVADILEAEAQIVREMSA